MATARSQFLNALFQRTRVSRLGTGVWRPANQRDHSRVMRHLRRRWRPASATAQIWWASLSHHERLMLRRVPAWLRAQSQ